MKQYILFALVFSLTSAFAQNLTLTKANNEPVIGDTTRYVVLDTAQFVGGLNVSNTGSAAVWNYADLISTSNVLTTAYVGTTDVANPPSGCTIASKQGSLNSFYKSVSTPSTQFEFMGMKSSSLTLTFSNYAIQHKYPFSLNDTYTDAYSGNFTFSLSGTAAGNVTVTADGNGTLTLPGGTTLTNVLRVKSTQSTNMNAIIVQGTMKQTIYNFYHSSQKYPVLTISYQSVSMAGQSPSVTAQVLGNKSHFVVGMNEPSKNEIQMNAFPNPFTVSFTLEVDANLEPSMVIIKDITGKTVLSQNYISPAIQPNLQPGIYFLEVHTNKGLARKKIIQE